MVTSYIVFFDTFTHNCSDEENIDCIRFKSGVELSKVCVLPFGSVVESNLSDEPLIGATNPASFDLKVYSNSQTNCVSLHNVASYRFNEKSGINTILFDTPVQSNFLLLRGRYSTLTVVLFGHPAISLNVQSTNLSIPPPSIDLEVPKETPLSINVGGFCVSGDVSRSSIVDKVGAPVSWSQSTADDFIHTQPSNGYHVPLEGGSTSVDCTFESKTNEQKVFVVENAGLYEDGEIQDVDYEEISSNEELFSEIDDVETGHHEDDHQSPDADELMELETQILSYQYKLDINNLIEQYTSGFVRDRLRIADPTLTLFELYCWILERSPLKEDTAVDGFANFYNKNEPSGFALLPPPNDWMEASQSAEFLIELVRKYNSEYSAEFNEEWVEMLENIEPHLSPGLAFLHLTDQKSYEVVSQALVFWVFSGLNLDLAMRQHSDPSFIVRHLTVGIQLAGLMTGSIHSEFAKHLLYPTLNDANTLDGSLENTQIQHLLLNLLESALVTTPLKLVTCRALDQTTRLPIGIQSFFGLDLSDTAVLTTTDRKKSLDGVEATDCGLKQHTPYQRLLQLISESKNSRVTTAYHKLLTKLHTFELLMEYRSLLDKLMNQLDTIAECNADEFEAQWHDVVRSQRTWIIYTKEIDTIVKNAPHLIANPRSSCAGPLLLNESHKGYDPYAGLFSMFDSCHIVDSIVLMLEQLPVKYNRLSTCIGWNNWSVQLQGHFLVKQTYESICCLLSTLMHNSYGLTYLAFRLALTSRLIRICMAVDWPVALDRHCQGHRSALSNVMLIGMELVFKLEALHYIDSLVAWTRTKGVTGVCSYLVAQLNTSSNQSPLDDCTLRDILFGLVRLSAFSPNPMADLTLVDQEWIKSTLAQSAPTWIAQVLVMDDYFSSVLILLEALAEHDAEQQGYGMVPVAKSRFVDDQGLAKTEAPGQPMLSEVSNPFVTKATIHNHLNEAIQLAGLVNAIVLLVLRHAEDISYLDRYGPRMFQLLAVNTGSQEVLNDFTPSEIFTRLNSFRCLAGTYLSCFRDYSTKSNVANLLNLPPSSPFNTDAYGWLVSQLKPLCTDLDEVLDQLTSSELADLLLMPTPPPTHHHHHHHHNRRSYTAGNLIPPGLLIVLRLLKHHCCLDCVSSSSSAMMICERQLVLSRSRVLIELFAANGFHLISKMLQHLSDFFIIQCQASMPHLTAIGDFIEMSTMNANVSLIFSLFDLAIQLITAMLRTILPIESCSFRDANIVKPLFQVYACCTYVHFAPGPKLDQLKRIRRNVIYSLLAYTRPTLETVELNVQDVGKSLWVWMLRELIHFTISSPCFFVPGIKLFCNLLPLELPIMTIKSLNEEQKAQMVRSRDLWTVHLMSISNELVSLIELLGSTSPSAANPLYKVMVTLSRRLVDLGSPFASLLVNACFASMTEVWNSVLMDVAHQDQSTVTNAKMGDIDSSIPPSSVDLASNNMTSSIATTSNSNASAMSMSTHGLGDIGSSSTQLLLLSSTQTLADETSRYEMKSADDSMGAASTIQSVNKKIADLVRSDVLSKLKGCDDLNAILSLLDFTLQLPKCRLSLVDALRQPSDIEENELAVDAPSKTNNQHAQLLAAIIESLLVECSDKDAHIRTQLKVLHCISVLMDVSSLHSLISINLKPYDDELQFLADTLPHSALIKDIGLCLIKHINHPDRGLATLPAAFNPLIQLAQHEFGFVIVREILDSPCAFTNGQHLFANIIQRVNDCFSADNPDCQSTLKACLCLIQALVTTNQSGLTFGQAVKSDNNSNDVKFTRKMVVSDERIRELLGWSGSGNEGKPVRDLHALLEMLADDEPSLEYLRSGMKNMICLLSNEFYINSNTTERLASPTELDVKLPEPRDLAVIWQDFLQFVAADKAGDGKLDLWIERLESQLPIANDFVACPYSQSSKPMMDSDVGLIRSDLTLLVATSLNGMSITDELAKYGRQQDCATEVTIRHQKRRRGQTSIIHTGTSAKKFVAPMRGRGFYVMRNGQVVSNTNSSGGSGSASAGIRGPDPFRSRPLNTSRPPSMHVDDFTKLEKEENKIEDTIRSRAYRDTRNNRGRGIRFGQGRVEGITGSGSNQSMMSLSSNSASSTSSNSSHPISLLPNCPLTAPVRSTSSLSFGLDPRRDRHMR